MLPASGQVTESAKPNATAASTALPPALSISAAAALAAGLLLTAIACGANVAFSPAGRCHPAGKFCAIRAGIAGSPTLGAAALLLLPTREQETSAHNALRAERRSREDAVMRALEEGSSAGSTKGTAEHGKPQDTKLRKLQENSELQSQMVFFCSLPLFSLFVDLQFSVYRSSQF